MSVSHEVLISLLVFSKNGEAVMCEVFNGLKDFVQPIHTSSVYQVKGDRTKIKSLHDITSIESFSGLCVVVKARTHCESKEVCEKLMGLEYEHTSSKTKKTVSLNLLTFDDNIKMTPRLTLPHPELHQRPELLVPAAEAWGSYHHPVLNDSLQLLAKKFQSNEWGEFFSQAQSVLDFSFNEA